MTPGHGAAPVATNDEGDHTEAPTQGTENDSHLTAEHAPETDVEEFLDDLTALGVAIIRAPEGGDEFARPTGYQHSRVDGNADARAAHSRTGGALLGLMGGRVAVVDIDTKNGADPDKVRTSFAALEIRIYAEVRTPSGGWHFYVSGHPDLRSVSASKDRDGLVGFPGVEILSTGRNAFLPGTRRPKYGHEGYTVVRNDLAMLADEGDDDSAEALLAWVDSHRASSTVEAAPSVSTEELEATLEELPALRQALAAWLPSAEDFTADCSQVRRAPEHTVVDLGPVSGTWETGGSGSGLVPHLAVRAIRADATRTALGLDPVYADIFIDIFADAGSRWTQKIKQKADYAAERGPLVPKDWTERVKIARFARKVATGSTTALADDDAASLDSIDLLGYEKMTDANIVDIFAAIYADRVRYVRQTRQWLLWDGILWEPVDEHAIIGLSTNLSRQLVYDAAKRGNDLLTKAAAARQGRARIEAVVALAKGHDLIRVHVDALDGDHDLVNCPNGVVNLRTGELMPHDPDRMMTKVAPVNYVPGATHPDWDKARADLEPEVEDFLQVVMGQAITGEMPPEDVATFFYGQGANTKTTIVRAAMSAVGEGATGYATLISERALITDGKGNQHPTELMEFYGKRLAVLEELPNRGDLNMQRLKKVTAERMEARRMKANPITWSPTHTLFVTTNHLPQVVNTEHGSWRRVRMVNFPIQYVATPEEVVADHLRLRDLHLRPRLQKAKAQREAVLAWLVAGAVRYYEAGRQVPKNPAQVEEMTRQWKDSTNPLGRFLNEHTEVANGWCIPGDDLYKQFTHSLVEDGFQKWGVKLFGERMKDQSVITSGRVRKARPRVASHPGTDQPQVSYHPGRTALVKHEYADGQQVSCYVGLRWRDDAPTEGP